MHFSIPETSEHKDINQGNFTVYHLHANGILHCKLRFKQFNSLHEQLKKQFGIYSLPFFPPKKLKIFNLTEIEIQERRASLEKYMQIISQDERISNSNLFNDFLLNAQQETLNAIRESIKIDVLLGDNSKLNLQIMSTDNSNLVKDTICRELRLPIKYTPYFSLFIVKQETIESNLVESNSTKSFNQQNKYDEQFINSKKYKKNQLNCKYILIRKLMDFESPYLSLKNANLDNNIYYLKLIKFYWNINLDDKLIDNEIALNLLYIQTVNEFEKRSTEINKDHYQYLESLALRQSKKEYITFAKCVKGYGLMKFEQCLSDFPKPNTKCQISISSNELILKTFLNNSNGKIITKEFILRITRIRCWRLTTGLELKKSKLNHNKSNTFINTSSLDNDFKYELSIEYLISKDDLKWIIIKSEQAVLISTCLKSVIEELVLQKNNLPLYEEKSNEINVNLRKNSCNYYKSNDKSLNNSIQSIEDDYNLDLVSCNLMEKSLSETILVTSNKVKFTNCINQPKNRKLRNLVHNSYYDGIGDDDL